MHMWMHGQNHAKLKLQLMQAEQASYMDKIKHVTMTTATNKQLAIAMIQLNYQ